MQSTILSISDLLFVENGNLRGGWISENMVSHGKGFLRAKDLPNTRKGGIVGLWVPRRIMNRAPLELTARSVK
jgi:hypothetical protein